MAVESTTQNFDEPDGFFGRGRLAAFGFKKSLLFGTPGVRTLLSTLLSVRQKFSFASSELSHFLLRPTPCAVGFILLPLRG
jgi:hypothetical protein